MNPLWGLTKSKNLVETLKEEATQLRNNHENAVAKYQERINSAIAEQEDLNERLRLLDTKANEKDIFINNHL